MKSLQITSMTASEIEALLKSKEDYKTAARLVSILPLAKGQSSRKAQEILLLSHNQILIWAKRFNEFGLEGLKDRLKTGKKPKMSNEQLQWLKDVVLNQSPTEHGYNTETRTAPMLVEIIKTHCNIVYSDDTVYVILKKKLHLTYKKGKGYYPEADPKKQEVFVSDFKKKLLESPSSDIYLFEDECSMSNTANVSYKWSEKGKQPLVEQKQYKRERVTLFGSVNPVSGEVITQVSKTGNAKEFKKYLKRILYAYKNTNGMIHMILDNVRFHHARLLEPFLEKHKSKLTLIFLPPYSPNLNPVERVWWFMRKKISNNRYVDSLEKRIKAFHKMFAEFEKPNDITIRLCNLNYSV